MRPSDQLELPDDLRGVEDRLRAQRDDASALELGQLKQRAMTQFKAGVQRSGSRRTPVAAALSALALLLCAGGAVALSGMDQHPNTSGGAADTQYKPPHRCKKHHHGKKCRAVKGKHIKRHDRQGGGRYKARSTRHDEQHRLRGQSYHGHSSHSHGHSSHGHGHSSHSHGRSNQNHGHSHHGTPRR